MMIMKIEIKNKVEEIDQSKVLIGREFNHVVFHFSKFHNNNIIQLTSSAGPVVNTTVGGFALLPDFNRTDNNNVNTRIRQSRYTWRT